MTVKRKKKTVKHRCLISCDRKTLSSAIDQIIEENREGFLALGRDWYDREAKENEEKAKTPEPYLVRRRED